MGVYWIDGCVLDRLGGCILDRLGGCVLDRLGVYWIG